MFKLILKRKLTKKPSYLIAVVKIDETQSLNKVVEVIGSYNFSQGKLVLNVFRLIYWISNKCAISGRLVYLLYIFRILK